MSPEMTDWPRRGQVWWVQFDPAIGGEIRKTRPAVVVSNDGANRVLNRIQVVPLTGSTSRVYAGEALVDVNGRQSKAAADQLATVSKLRLGKQLASLNAADMAAVEGAILVQLNL